MTNHCLLDGGLEHSHAGLVGAGGDMGGHGHVGSVQQRVGGVERLGIGHVEACPEEVAAVQCLHEGIVVDETAARRVDEHRARLHRGERLGVEHPRIVGVHGHVDRHHVAGDQQFLQSRRPDHR